LPLLKFQPSYLFSHQFCVLLDSAARAATSLAQPPPQLRPWNPNQKLYLKFSSWSTYSILHLYHTGQLF